MPKAMKGLGLAGQTNKQTSPNEGLQIDTAEGTVGSTSSNALANKTQIGKPVVFCE